MDGLTPRHESICTKSAINTILGSHKMKETSMSQNMYKTLKEVAQELGITPDSLRQRIARGSLKAIKIGTTWSIDAKTYSKLMKGTPMTTKLSPSKSNQLLPLMDRQRLWKRLRENLEELSMGQMMKTIDTFEEILDEVVETVRNNK